MRGWVGNASTPPTAGTGVLVSRLIAFHLGRVQWVMQLKGGTVTVPRTRVICFLSGDLAPISAF